MVWGVRVFTNGVQLFKFKAMHIRRQLLVTGVPV